MVGGQQPAREQQRRHQIDRQYHLLRRPFHVRKMTHSINARVVNQQIYRWPGPQRLQRRIQRILIG